jgi:hypothetical protein
MIADMPRLFLVFKYTLYTLLAVNVYLFFRHATFHEGIDCVGWLMLLAAFEWQTRKEENARTGRGETIALAAVEAAAYALVVYAWGNYYLHGMWLDFVNATLWLCVVAMLSADVWWKGASAWRKRRLHHALKTALYAGLVAIAVTWGVQEDILNFYDAFLWIVCFFAIEMNVLQRVYHLWKRKDATP